MSIDTKEVPETQAALPEVTGDFQLPLNLG